VCCVWVAYGSPANITLSFVGLWGMGHCDDETLQTAVSNDIGSFWLVQLFLGRTLKKLDSNVQGDSSYAGSKRTKI
jgi:hypothetical protein